MTNERIDHVALSEARLEESEDLRSMREFAHADLKAKQSQVHAALAMVERQDRLIEQQRIANLIALSESGRTTVNGARAALSGLYDGNPDFGSSNMTLRSDIAAALGISND